jgi:AraC family transcriptional regulator
MRAPSGGAHVSDTARIAKIYDGLRAQPVPYQPIVASGSIWSRIRLEELRSPPGEEAEAAPTEHGVVLNVGTPFRWEIAWADEPSVRSSIQQTGRIAIFPAHHRHRSCWFDPFQVIVLAVDRDLLVEAAGAAGHVNPEHVQLRREMSCDDPFLRHLILALREALEADQRSSAFYGESVAVVVAMHLVYRYAATTPPAASPRTLLPMHRMRRVAEYIQANLEVPISLQALGEVAQMSVFHFSRLFKARTGVTPHQYVLKLRIARAKSLLNDPSRTMADIAAQCGFAHQQHFADAFRRNAGVTPTAYRERHMLKSDGRSEK